MKFLSPLFLLLFPFFLHAQACNCESNFNWVKKTFEENDAGFAYILEVKGQADYEKHNSFYKEKVKNIADKGKCMETLYGWLTFFRSGHIAINPMSSMNNSGEEKESSKKEIMKAFKDWEKMEVDVDEFRKYLEAQENPGYEGIYRSGQYLIGVKKVEQEYIGFIIEADGVYWTEGQVKMRIKADGSVVYYMRDHSGRNFDQAEWIGKNYLKMGFISLTRELPKWPVDPKVETYFKSMSTNVPLFETLDEQTVLLRIPTFSGTEKDVIDSVILANKEKILQTENFIIDIRNNGGGSDRSYAELLPIMYTNPMRGIGVAFRSTPLNNQRMLDFINIPEYEFSEEEKEWAQVSYDTLSKHLGEFVNLDTTIVAETTYDTIYPFPKNIAILINENNGSTAEQFLLDSKQSRKVKLYGKTTAGVLDVANMLFVKSPCQEFELGYCLSKSYRIPHMAIDEKGIQPDFYLDEEIRDHEWVEHVTRLLKNN